MQAQYIERVGKALRYLGAGNDSKFTRVQGGGLEPVRFDAYVPEDSADITIVVMPCRL